MLRTSLPILLVALLLSGCPQPPERSTSATPAAPAGQPVRIWADPPLRLALEGLAPQFRERYAAGWDISYVERGTLLEAIEAEPPADGETPLAAPEILPSPQALLIERSVTDTLRNGGHIDNATLRTFGGDRLALIQRADDRWPPTSIYEAPVLRFEQLGLGDVDTSFGYYGEQVLVSSGIRPRIADRFSHWGSYDELLAALADGTLDMALGPHSAVVGHNLKLVSIVPADLHEDVRYLAVAVSGHTADAGVQALLRFLAEEPEIQLLLGGYGFVDRETALVEIQ